MQKFSVFVVAMMVMMLASCQTTRSGHINKFDNVSEEVLELNDQGNKDFHEGRYASGLENYDKAMELSPKNPEIAFNLINAYTNFSAEVTKLRGWDSEKLYKECLSLARVAVKSRREDYTLWQNYGFVFNTAEYFGVKPDWGKAAKVWSDARKHARGEQEVINASLWEAQAHIAAGNHKKAKACLDEVLVIYPESQRAQNLLASVQG